MAVTLKHPTTASTFGGARPASTSWFAKLIAVLASYATFLAEVREEERKGHARYPHLMEW